MNTREQHHFSTTFDAPKNGELPGGKGLDTPALPEVVDRATWQAELDKLRVREKAHTHDGPPAGYVPHIWLQDAITALLLALTESAPSGVYGIVDDAPVTRAEIFTALAHAVGCKHLLVLPDLLMRLMTGPRMPI